jgi:hypothetical protein
MNRYLLLGVLAAAPAFAQSDPAAIEAYRRLPYCRLAPDGRHLAQEPCRRPPTRGFAARRAAPALQAPLSPVPPPAASPDDAPTAMPSTARSIPAAPAAPPAAALPPVPPPAVPSPVQPLNQCDLAGCRGAGGALYQQGAGNIVLDPSGRMCTRHGQWVHCQ